MCTSVTVPTGLKTVVRSERRSVPAINVNGDKPSTRYNNAFANPLEITSDNFDDAALIKHIKESLEHAFAFISRSQDPAPPLSKKGDLDRTAIADGNGEDPADGDNSDGSFDPSNMADARQEIVRSIKQRQGQPKFRRRLLKAYRSQCSITGCAIEALLEAAHIMPYRGTHSNHPSTDYFCEQIFTLSST
jgi:hypothetical protein